MLVGDGLNAHASARFMRCVVDSIVLTQVLTNELYIPRNYWYTYFHYQQ